MKKASKKIIAIILLLCMLFTCTANVYAKSMADRIKAMLRSKILFEDLAKFNEAVDTDDPAVIFQSVLEIYPDLVALSKKCNENDSVATILSNGDSLMISSAIVVAGGLIATAIIVVNKKKENK